MYHCYFDCICIIIVIFNFFFFILWHVACAFVICLLKYLVTYLLSVPVTFWGSMCFPLYVHVCNNVYCATSKCRHSCYPTSNICYLGYLLPTTVLACWFLDNADQTSGFLDWQVTIRPPLFRVHLHPCLETVFSSPQYWRLDSFILFRLQCERVCKQVFFTRNFESRQTAKNVQFRNVPSPTVLTCRQFCSQRRHGQDKTTQASRLVLSVSAVWTRHNSPREWHKLSICIASLIW